MPDLRLQRTRDHYPEGVPQFGETSPAPVQQRPFLETVQPGEIVVMTGSLPRCGLCQDAIIGHPWVMYGHDGQRFCGRCAYRLNPVYEIASPEHDAAPTASVPVTVPPAVLTPQQAAEPVPYRCFLCSVTPVSVFGGICWDCVATMRSGWC